MFVCIYMCVYVCVCVFVCVYVCVCVCAYVCTYYADEGNGCCLYCFTADIIELYSVLDDIAFLRRYSVCVCVCACVCVWVWVGERKNAHK